MTGPQHYQAAEQLLERARSVERDPGNEPLLVQMANAHATLALAAATAMHPGGFDRWYKVAGEPAA